MIVYIGLGSNLNNPAFQVGAAMMELRDSDNMTVLATSSLYQTRPLKGSVGIQDDYINAVVKIETALSPEALLTYLLDLERRFGRKRHQKWASRLLDCDILLYGDQVINEDELVIPHYDLARRNFVVYPLFELEPEMVLPTGERLADLVQQLPAPAIVEE